MRVSIPIAVVLVLGCGGGLAPSYPTSTPPAAVVTVEMPTLEALSKTQAAKWADYLAAHPHWQVREERGCTFAVRLEPQKDSNGNVVYEGTLNGFYSDFGSKDVVQTRVLTGLGCSYGFGSDRGQIVRTGAMAGPVQLVLEDYMNQPGTNSELLVTGAESVTVEVYEQSHLESREFTQLALQSVEAELKAVVDGTATLPESSTRPGPPTLSVSDGFQPGIYDIEAWVNPGSAGTTFTRVIYLGPDGSNPPPPQVKGREGKTLSADRMLSRSSRSVGFSDDADVMHRYTSGVTVYEGDWGQPYRARFEIWLEDENGATSKLVEHERVIEGWMR